MINIIKKNLYSFAAQKKEEAVKLCLFFSGDLASAVLLRILLAETKHQVCLYYIDKRKYPRDNRLSDEEIEKEELSKERIIKYFDSRNKNLTCQEVELFHNEIRSYSDVEDIHLHASILDKIYSIFGGFDAFLIPLPPDKLEAPFELFKLYSAQQKLERHVEFIFPFLSAKADGFYAEIIINSFHYIINFDRIYNDHKEFLDELIKGDDRKEVDKHVVPDTAFDLLFRYLIPKNRSRCPFFVEQYGDRVSSKLYNFSLLHHIPWHYSNEKFIGQCVDKGKVTHEELNLLLANFVYQFDSSQAATSETRIKRLDFFLRLFGHKVFPETMDRLLRRTQWPKWQNITLLDKLAEFGGDVGELMIYCLRVSPNDRNKLEERVGYLLDNHADKMSEPQLSEALVIAFRLKHHNLCRKLIEKGADERIPRLHRYSYGISKFKQDNPGLMAGRAYWRTKDRIIVREALNKLGNPQEKVPPILHVTGSNGKGSTCAYLRAILEQAGHKVHMFTSPALIRSNENFIVSGEEITDRMYYKYLSKVAAAYNELLESEEFNKQIEEADARDRKRGYNTSKDGVLHWSIIIPAVIAAFAENPADAAIIEVISGGEKDLTNIFNEKTTAAAIVNTIIFGDNHASLWKNIEETALTKSRLCKEGSVMVCGPQEKDVFNIVRQTALEKNCRIVADNNNDWSVECAKDQYILHYNDYKIPLRRDSIPGQYQLNNLTLAYIALLSQDKIPVSAEKLQVGLKDDLRMLGRIKCVDRDLNYQPFLKKHMPDKVKVFLGTVKEKYGMKDFMSYMKTNFPEHPAHFVVNIPSASERVMAILDILWESGLNIKSVTIFDNLRGKDRDVLKQRIDSLDKSLVKVVIKTSLSGALSTALEVLKETGDGESVFSLITAGIQIFPRIILHLLYSGHLNPNYTADLEFAKENNLLQREELDFYTLP